MWYWAFRTAIVIIFRTFFRLRVEGKSNLPEKTNFIVAANHASFLDPFAVGASIPKKIYWLALRDFYKIFWASWFMRVTDALPTGGSSRKAAYLLTNSKNVGLFPEGVRAHDGRLREFKKGAAFLALKTGRPIVPCAIFGTERALPRKAKFPKFVPIKVKIGKPIYLLKEFDDRIDDLCLHEGIFKVRNAIKAMLDAG
ncbi:MAG: 1-acyl-sn-glycerol-3-phosphate acyltransferase [Candidatus Omnitrophota bacterium]|nr:MAG: 1-acyl-sn-glycerol-3-phosphate acyltransferase [Candidatus Omnitrophota bacterium]